MTVGENRLVPPSRSDSAILVQVVLSANMTLPKNGATSCSAVTQAQLPIKHSIYEFGKASLRRPLPPGFRC